MSYPYEQIFAGDPSAPERVAVNGVVTIFEPGDATMAPLTITTLDGLPLANPMQVNESGFGPAFQHDTLDQVAWAGGGFTGVLTSYKGMKEAAVGAQQGASAAAINAEQSRLAAEEAVRNAQAPSDEAVDAALERADIPATIQQAVSGKLDKGEASTTFAVKPDNGGKPVGKGEVVLNVRDFGAKGDGIADDWAAIQDAMHEARDRSATVIFPHGTYNMSRKFYVYSETIIDLCGSTIKRCFDSGPGGVSLCEISSHSSNVIIRNGTLDGNGASYPGVTESPGFNILGATGLRDSILENLAFKDVVQNHSLDLSNFLSIKVLNCRFLGYKSANGETYAEAIQLDPSILASAGKQNQELLVSGCYFGPSDTPGFGTHGVGIGNHASYEGSYDNDIKIVGNTFDGCAFAGVRPFKWSDVQITGNTFNNCRRGVHVTPGSTPDQKAEAGENHVISGNTFKGCNEGVLYAAPNAGKNDSWAKHQGVVITGNSFQDGANGLSLAFISSLIVANNAFKSMRIGMKLGYCNTVSIAGNTGDSFTDNMIWVTEIGMTAGWSTLVGQTFDITITGNTARNIGYRGIHVQCAAINTTITSNTFVDSSNTTTQRQGIAIEGGATGGSVVNNSVLVGAPEGRPNYGVLLTADVFNFFVGPNFCPAATTQEVRNLSGTSRVSGAHIKGSPEGVMAGAVGSTYLRTDGGAGACLYVKESGAGTTGWVAK